MTKRPDQHQIDQNESQATDYKFRRQTEDQNRRGPDVETLEGGRGNNMTPRETLDVRKQQSAEAREEEVERAAEVKDRGEGNHPSSDDDQEPEGDRGSMRSTGAGEGSREERDEALGKSGERSHQQSASDRQDRQERKAGQGNQERGSGKKPVGETE